MIFHEKIPRTAIEVYKLLPEGTRVEVLNGALHMCEPTSLAHQEISGKLLMSIYPAVKKARAGDFVHGPIDVYLEKQDSALQPDLLFISNANKKVINKEGYIYGPPDLIIEISEKEIKREKIVKKKIYEKAGVKEYFIVDPRTKMIVAYRLKNKKYQYQYSRKKYFFSSLLKIELTFD